MITKTKICGITTTEDYIACRDAGAAFVGMVHYPGSSRHLGLGALSKLAACSAAADPHAPDRVLLQFPEPLLAASRGSGVQRWSLLGRRRRGKTGAAHGDAGFARAGG